jgi:hypothetical protein
MGMTELFLGELEWEAALDASVAAIYGPTAEEGIG